ncbi:MAG TPA: DUF979 family protein [Dokdonella sp.]|uniref:5-oxoproline transporter, DUF979 family subunit n=1 Tax=Dokdonella sp. TaxID=2291710 RepID=UPI0025C01C71|nr:DUF979 family protein [Dokdonella sp.]MBX3693466.1 DUF979 family protein [Dokdonella sp.]MCW5568536.1 DUF979 family protein [Dokdonella sp.]HNR92050.1 DUF979 family protein [Dokdonella sp.]
MFRLEHLYWLVAAFLLASALLNLRERRWSMAAFWLVLATPFVFGEAILRAHSAGLAWPAQLMGLGVIALGMLAALNPLRSGTDNAEAATRREAESRRIGPRLFLPALAIPVLTAALYFGSRALAAYGIDLLETRAQSLIALGLASVLALLAAFGVTRARTGAAIVEGRRLLDSLGWAILLPMLLATLGGVFAATGVGTAITPLVEALIPVDSRLACVLAFAAGMVVFTLIMGNAFAAFPVMMAGLGLPLLVRGHGADPAALGAIGMLTGYCGTLLTPMAANFNIVPAVLLELRNPYGVIRAQVGTALVLMSVNILLLATVVFH